MVPTVVRPQDKSLAGEHRALIVEIVGPAGAGKTTLFRALEKLGPEFRMGDLPPVWNFWYIPFFVKHILLLAPTLFRLWGKGGRSLSRRELAWMAMLHGWPELLKKEVQGKERAILLDQGPVFLMAILYLFGPEGLRNAGTQGYWTKIYERWVHSLDLIIWLDTSDDVLMKRIRTRKDEHLVKGETDGEIIDFLGKYRGEYGRLIDILTTKNPAIGVLRIDTGKTAVDDLQQLVMDFIQKKETGGGSYESC
jgi:cytidylate kinase